MSTIIRGYKYRIYPDEEQSKQIDTFINLYRYVYNWGVAKEEEAYGLYKQGLSECRFYNFYNLCHLFTEERNKPEKYWLKEIPNTTARLALRSVVHAYQHFFSGVNRYPRFKSKKTAKPSFNTRNDRFRIENNCIKIEGINTRIPLGFDSGFNITKSIDPAITRDNLGRYYVSFSLEEESKDLDIPKSEPIGIDLGVRKTFTLSTGEIFNQPNEKINKLKRKLKRQQRHVTRDINRRMAEARRTKTKYEDIPKSKRSEKRLNKLRKTHRKIHNIKDTFYHKITKNIVDRNPEYVCMETFSTKHITKENKIMNKILHDVSFGDIIVKMKYKCDQYNIPFIQAPMGFPSTQLCSSCGSVKKMYNNHTYKCPVCGMIEDRDINAAINLRDFGLVQYMCT